MPTNKDIELKLIQNNQHSQINSFQFGQNSTQPAPPANQPQITLSKMTLVVICPLLVIAHFWVAKICEIHPLEFIFMTSVVALIVNYVGLIKKYDIKTLPDGSPGAALRCILGVIQANIAILLIGFFDFNAAGAMIFGMIWEQKIKNKFGLVGWMLLIIAIGSFLMQEKYSWLLLLSLISGILLEMSSACLFLSKQFSVYTIAHTFIRLTAVCTPITFKFIDFSTPSGFQWVIIILCGLTMLITVLLTIKLMQFVNTSVVVGVMGGLIMVGTSGLGSGLDLFGGAIVLVAVVTLIKFYDD